MDEGLSSGTGGRRAPHPNPLPNGAREQCPCGIDVHAHVVPRFPRLRIACIHGSGTLASLLTRLDQVRCGNATPVGRIDEAGFDADTAARLVHRNAEVFLGLPSRPQP